MTLIQTCPCIPETGVNVPTDHIYLRCILAIVLQRHKFCDFLFSSLDEKAFPNRVLLFMDGVCSNNANAFL